MANAASVPAAATHLTLSKEVFGIGYVAASCMLSSIALVLMKASADTEAEQPMWRRYRWLCGFACMLGAAPLSVMALASIPLSMAAPFAGLTIVFSLMLAASGLLGERELLSRSEVACAMLVLAGVTTVALCGPRSDGHRPSVDELLGRFHDGDFLAFACVLLSPIVLWAPCLAIPRVRPAWYVSFNATKLGTACSALCAAACGALSQLCLKVIAVCSAHIATGDPENPTTRGGFWLAVVGLLCMAPLQLFLLDATLGASSVAFGVPIYQSLLIILTTAMGGVFFLEFAHATPASIGGFAFGVAAAMLGVAILSRGGAADDEDDALLSEGHIMEELHSLKSLKPRPSEGREGSPAASLDNMMGSSCALDRIDRSSDEALDLIMETPEDSGGETPPPPPPRRHSMRSARYSIGVPLLTAQAVARLQHSGRMRSRAESMPLAPADPALLEGALLRSRSGRSRSMAC
jgi:hypothetical protein